SAPAVPDNQNEESKPIPRERQSLLAAAIPAGAPFSECAPPQPPLHFSHLYLLPFAFQRNTIDSVGESCIRDMQGEGTLNAREQEILHSLVRAYIQTGEPVSSRSIARRRHQPLSPASIRNVMADLADG